MTPTWMALVAGLWLVVALLMGWVLLLTWQVRQLRDRAVPDPVLRLRRRQPQAGDDVTLGPRIGSTIDLEPLSSPERAAGERRSRIVLFLNSSCSPSHMLGDELIAAGEDGFALVGSDLVVVTDELGAEFYRGLGADEVVVQPRNEISRHLGIIATPYGIAIDGTGVVRWSGVVANFDDILAMVAAFGIDAR